MKIDYKPKHVDFASLKDGKMVEFLNFVHLDSAELSLHRIRIAGVKGWKNLATRVANIWIPYIRDTQLPNMASGLSPVRPFVNIGSGVADLVMLPVEQFKKDGRIIKGLQKGTGSFLKAATMETVKLGARVAAGTQVLLEKAEEMIGGAGAMASAGAGHDEASQSAGAAGSGQTRGNWAGSEFAEQSVGRQHGSVAGGSVAGVSTSGGAEARRLSKFSEQPRDIREGLQMGYASLSEGVRNAARTIFAVPTEAYESSEEVSIPPCLLQSKHLESLESNRNRKEYIQGGNHQTVQSIATDIFMVAWYRYTCVFVCIQSHMHPVVRAVPVAILQPIIGATDAVSKALVGLSNTLDKTQQRRMEDKYKRQ
eukprot:jgi/Hompol1/3184/HPOL_003137-RA